jgi:hypothetical protein
MKNQELKRQIIATLSTTKQTVEVSSQQTIDCVSFGLQFLSTDHLFNTKTFTRPFSSFTLSLIFNIPTYHAVFSQLQLATRSSTRPTN